MSNPNVITGLVVAGSLAFSACSGNNESTPIQDSPQEFSTAQTIPEIETTTVVSDTTEPVVPIVVETKITPFDRLNYSSLHGDWFPEEDSFTERDLTGEQCAALALARFSLGEFGKSAYGLFEIPHNDGTTSVGGEEFTSPDVLREMSETIFDTLDGNNDGNIEFFSPQHQEAVIAGISAASVIDVAVSSIDDFNDLEPEESLRINGTKEDSTIAMLDQARTATAEALDTGCSYLRPELYNGTLEP